MRCRSNSFFSPPYKGGARGWVCRWQVRDHYRYARHHHRPHYLHTRLHGGVHPRLLHGWHQRHLLHTVRPDDGRGRAHILD